AFAVRSHQRAAKALAAGNFADETVSVDVTLRTVGSNNKLQEETIIFALAVFYFQKAWEYRPTRAEPLYQLARLYRLRSQNNIALMYALQG
ncbi:hypothetical protein ACT453_49355, partial [Bacillus sp. D-CC]